MQNVDGLDQIDRDIQGMIRMLDGEATERAISAAGEVIFREVEISAPVRTGKLKASLRTGHYRDTSGGKSRRYKTTIGVEDSKRFGIMHYAVFLEYGTAKMNAKPFMRPAFDRSSDKAIQTFANELEKALR